MSATGEKAVLTAGIAWVITALQAGSGIIPVVTGVKASAAVAARHATRCFTCGLLSVG
jgi:hypothetical protein